MVKKPLRLAALVSALFAVSQASAIIYKGIEFPDGSISFADRVVSYDPSFGIGPGPYDANYTDPNSALGAPNYSSPYGSVSLGNGGRLVLEFLDNFLTGSGNSDYDLHIFEIGPAVEAMDVHISKDGVDWKSVGSVSGSTSSINIDLFGYGPSDLFRFVQLTDVDGDSYSTGATAGADIDAVGAISTVVNEDYASVPDSGTTLGLLGLALLGLIGLRQRDRS